MATTYKLDCSPASFVYFYRIFVLDGNEKLLEEGFSTYCFKLNVFIFLYNYLVIIPMSKKKLFFSFTLPFFNGRFTW